MGSKPWHLARAAVLKFSVSALPLFTPFNTTIVRGWPVNIRYTAAGICLVTKTG